MTDQDASLLLTWAKLQGIVIHKNVSIQSTADAGLGIFVTNPGEITGPIISVPRSLVLTAANIRILALSLNTTLLPLMSGSDQAISPREVIVRFILFSLKCPQVSSNYYTPYIALLPDPTKSDLVPPVFWTEEQIVKVRGTSLFFPLQAKQRKLHADYDKVEARWSQVMKNHDPISFEDYVKADFLVTSRIMELGSDGEIGIVPVMDFANHGVQFDARYEIKPDEVELVWTDNGDIKEKEVLISYGTEKGTSEILFTYGFLVNEDEITRESVKMLVRKAPGLAEAVYGRPATAELVVELAGDDVEIQWNCDLLWLLCMNASDGFEISLPQIYDESEVELEVSIKGRTVNAKGDELIRAIKEEYDTDKEMKDVYELRRAAILSEWITEWSNDLVESELAYHKVPPDVLVEVTDGAASVESGSELFDEVTESLRQRESNVFLMVLRKLEARQHELLESESVKNYLISQSQEQQEQQEQQDPIIEESDEDNLR
ncbi:hypothetical protein V1512DRAFT_257320 [Lipomyces arxii]|uniref:uncharacterized protein n=1 Tax=Lipomyces arxii TaxID=56418 RepID=UPI0034CD2E00